MTTEKPPRHTTASSDIVGRTCPYCRFPIKAGGGVTECGYCRAVHHDECFGENGGCSVAGCAGGPQASIGDLRSRAETGAPGSPRPPQGETTLLRSSVPASPPPPPTTGRDTRRPRSGLGVVVVIIVLAAVVAGGALAYALTSTSSQTTTTVAVQSVTTTTSSDTGSGGASSDGSTGNTPGNSGPAATSSENSRSLPTAPTVTGQDSSGYNIGPGCSDNPQSSLQGCSDSPSTPAGDPEGQCPNGITVDAQTTTCALAESVYNAYTGDGNVDGYSQERKRSYTFTCRTGGSGTTGYTICEGLAGSAPLYLRWHK